jgi:hypothetical protein
MKTLITLFYCVAAAVAFGKMPEGVTVAIELKGAAGSSLTIARKDEPKIVLRFTNHTDRKKEVGVYLYHPHHKELPVLLGCAVRFLDEKGNVHPDAKSNGEWWSQYICWSTTFPEGERKNTREIAAHGEVEVEAPLHEILRVPAGGEPEGWMWNQAGGYLLGRHRFQVRFDGVISREFVLNVLNENQKEPNQVPEPTAPSGRGSS